MTCSWHYVGLSISFMFATGKNIFILIHVIVSWRSLNLKQTQTDNAFERKENITKDIGNHKTFNRKFNIDQPNRGQFFCMCFRKAPVGCLWMHISRVKSHSGISLSKKRGRDCDNDIWNVYVFFWHRYSITVNCDASLIFQRNE